MLETLRSMASGFIAKVLLALLIASFAVWGISDVFRGQSPNTIASIGKENISVGDFQIALNNFLTSIEAQNQRRLTAEEIKKSGISRLILQDLITKKTLDINNKELGLAATEDETLAIVRQDRRFHNLSGVFDPQLFETFLRRNGLSENQFMEQIKSLARNQQLSAALFANTPTPEKISKTLAKFENETRTISYFNVPETAATIDSKPDEKKLKDFYKTHQNNFFTPQLRDIKIAYISPEKAAADIEVSADQIRQVYDARPPDANNLPEKREISIIPFDSYDEAKDAANSVQAGKTTFAKIALNRSLKPEDLSLGLVTKDEVANEKLQQAAFAVEKPVAASAVETDFGPFVFNVTKIIPAKNITLDEVADDIKKNIAIQKARNELADIAEKIDDARAQGLTLAKVAGQFNLEYIDLGATDITGNIRGKDKTSQLPGEPGELLKYLFADNIDNFDPVTLADGTIIWYNVGNTTEPELKPFATVREEVEAQWRQTALDDKLDAMAREMVKKLNNGSDIETVAKAYKSKIIQSKPFTRTELAEVNPLIAGEAFLVAKGKYGNVRLDDSQAIFKVTSVKYPDNNNLLSQNKLVAPVNLGGDLSQAYIYSLGDNYQININQAVIDQLLR